jgi:CTP synthase (UTP-ammonia lyase)
MTEITVEVPGDPFLMATLFHVQIGSLHDEPLSPVIAAFAQAARRHSQAPAHVAPR